MTTLQSIHNHMATLDHSRNEAGKALNTLRDLNINANVLLNEISPNSTGEKDLIHAAIRELEDGEEKYSSLLEEFDDVNSQTIQEVSEEVNRGYSSLMLHPPPPATCGVKFVKHDKLMPEILDYSTSPVEFEQWATALQQWLD